MREHRLSAPLLVVLEITSRCNLKCAYCYNQFGGERRGGRHDLPFGVISEVVEDIADNGVFEVNLSGGEPLLHPSIGRIIRLLNEKEIGFSVVSNGTMVTPSLADELWETHAIPNIQISFDSHIPAVHEKTRGLFAGALNGLKLLAAKSGDRCLSPSVGIVVNRFNFATLCDTVAFFAQFTLRFHVMNVMGHSELALAEKERHQYHDEVLPALHELAQRNRLGISLFDDRYKEWGVKESAVECAHMNCLAGYTSVVIGTDLDVYPCDISRNSMGKWRHRGDLGVLYARCRDAWFRQRIPWCQTAVGRQGVGGGAWAC